MPEDLMMDPNPIGMGMMVIAILQWLKSSKLFPFITHDTATANKWFSYAIALASGLGIHLLASSGSPLDWLMGKAPLHLVLPPLPIIVGGLLHSGTQGVTQVFGYKVWQAIGMAIEYLKSQQVQDPPMVISGK